MMLEKLNKNEEVCRGFTLIEISIVLVVIGLLIGGVLKGQELIDNFRVAKTIKMIKSIESSVISFRHRYSALPGDIAANRVAKCDVTYNCTGGDENGAVASSLGANDYGSYTIIGINGMGMEATQFWKHLALTNFLGNIDPTADPLNDAGWGSTHPQAPLGGGVEFFYDGANAVGFDGHVLRFSGDGVSASYAGQGGRGFGRATGGVAAYQAAKIDRKMDDGDPNNGLIIIDYHTRSNDCKSQSEYIENSQELCLLFVRLF